MSVGFASSLLVHIFGNSPLMAVLNSALILFIAYWIWRLFLEPAIDIKDNIKDLFTQRDLGVLEIIPPKRTSSDPTHTQNLMLILQQLAGKHRVISLEIIGAKKTGIKYRVVAPPEVLPSIQKHFTSYMPELKFKKSKIELGLSHDSQVLTIQQARHFALPLKTHEDLRKTDPIAYIAGSLTHLKDNEEIVLQLAIKRYSSKKASRIYGHLESKGQIVLDGKLRYVLLTYWWIWIPALFIWVLTHAWQSGVIVGFLLWAVSKFGKHREQKLSALDEKLYADVALKLKQPLLQTDLRLFVLSPDRPGELVNDFISSLEPLNHAYQRLVIKRGHFGDLSQRHLKKLFVGRLASVLPFNSSVLGADELAMLFHFPYGVINTEGMIRSHSRTLPAPLSLKNDPNLDVMIGVNKHHGAETPIGLTETERERHMFIVGGTGSGKTTMLKYQIVQDIRNGKGLAVIDPHGDLAEELLEYIPEGRKKDLIYLNPDDLDHPIGVNLLELPAGLEGNELLREKDRVTEAMVSVMRKIFSKDDSGGHRIEYVLRNTVQTALTLDSPTIFTIFRLLNDGRFAKNAIKNLEDENLKIFWKDELGKAGSMQKVKMTAGITAKIGRFLFSASARAMLGQKKSSIDFNEILDGKILICNFSKGRLGEDTSTLFGVIVLAKLQLAALKRSERKQADRHSFYLYVDEFQNFATISFTQMLSEARKYKVFLTMAEQSTQQQDNQKLVDIILSNVGTVVVFRTGSPRDEELLLPLFEPYIEKGEIFNLPAYSFYCRIMSVNSQEPTSGETVMQKGL